MPIKRTKTKKTKRVRRTKVAPKTRGTKNAPRSQARALTRGLEPIMSIGPELMEVIDQLVQLMRETRDPRQLEQLDEQRVALSEHAACLIDGHLEDTTAQYQAAVESLQQVSQTIRQAIQGLESIKTVIQKAAKAVELAGKVAAMV
ncbi:hypothetical protein COMA1_10040 [Candidatus Nitrospira nitrosa]|uniref:Uncharacterized protein n=1 Tax=Candidatus Nitrospira nitrosa TaxID=1742972 RepID=A0A0S4L851_9BACT|nr:hypothetical protein [Candidatus Nitrospira nitrosa]CUS31298.1 hypothetical protein COMA1_10040 [Candidatus Nitrospira nitrosa]